MTKPIIRIHNVETDEVIDREMTDKEYADWQVAQAQTLAEKNARDEAARKRQEILDKLGLTQEEANILLG
jgi:hypothetical protein